jgi:hypothetical protein
MLVFSRAKWTALTGYAFAATGTILYTQLDRVADLRMGHNVLNAAVVGSIAATFGGFVTATVGSADRSSEARTIRSLLVETSPLKSLSGRHSR